MPEQEQESALVRFVKDLLAPGGIIILNNLNYIVSNKLILFLNISLLTLIFILFSLIVLGYSNVHVFITLFLSCGLLMSAN